MVYQEKRGTIDVILENESQCKSTTGIEEDMIKDTAMLFEPMDHSRCQNGDD